MGWCDFVSFRSEDNALDGVVVICFGERAESEVAEGDAEAVVVGVGGAGVDASFVERAVDEVEVELDGGAVFAEGEGDDVGGIVGLARRAPGGELDGSVVVAVELSADGGGLAAGVVGLDVSAKRDHSVEASRENFVGRIFVLSSLAAGVGAKIPGIN